MNINDQKFHYVLSLIADPSFKIQHQKEVFVFAKQKDKGQDTKSHEVVDKVMAYIEENSAFLKDTDIKNLEKIKARIVAEPHEINEQIETRISGFINIAKENSQKKIPMPSARPPQDFVCRLEEAPKNPQDLLQNLHLVVNHSPRYQLGNDLAVYDTTYGALPKDTDNLLIREFLKNALDRYQSLSSEEMDPELLQSLSISIEIMRDTLKPIQVVPIVILTEINKDPGALKLGLESALAAGKAIVTTPKLLLCHKNDPDFINKIDHADVYFQTAGGLIVILPRGVKPEERGFDPATMNLNNNSFGSHYLTFMSQNPLNVASNIRSILKDDTPDLGYFRLIFWIGHGKPPSDSDPKGTIAGIPTTEFQDGLQALKEKNMAFLFMASCYAGGENSTQIHLPDGTIPCPISFLGSTADPTKSTPQLHQMLDTAEKKLFRKQGLHLSANSLRTLTLQDLQRIAAEAVPSTLKDELINALTVLLPTNVADTAKVAYHLTESGIVLDLTSAIKSAPNRTFDTVLTIPDNDPQRKAYLISEPATPVSLEMASSKSILMRGGNSHHILDEIKAPNLELDRIVEGIIDPLKIRDIFSQEAQKGLAIGKLTCLIDGNETKIENVVIRNFPNSYTNANARQMVYQVVDQNMKPESYLLTMNHLGIVEEKQIISHEEAIAFMYQTFAETTPSLETLKQTTGGRKSELDFYEYVNHVFWKDQPPKGVELMQAIITQKNVDTIAANLKQDLLNMTAQEREKFQPFIKTAIQISKDVQLKQKMQILDAICDPASTFLTRAILSDKPLDDIQRIVESDRKSSAATTDYFNAAFHVALLAERYDIVKILLNNGGEIPDRDRKKTLELMITLKGKSQLDLMTMTQPEQRFLAEEISDAQDFAVVEDILKNFPNILSFVPEYDDQPVLFKLIKNYENYGQNKIINFLKVLNSLRISFDQPIQGANEPLTHFIFANVGMRPIKAILSAGIFSDLNVQDKEGNTPLHLVLNRGMKFLVNELVKGGARADIPNKNGKTAQDIAADLNIKLAA